MGMRVDGAELAAEVVALEPWSWIVVRTTDGRTWMEVMLNVSAAYYSRLLLLSPAVEVRRRDVLDRIKAHAAAHAHLWNATGLKNVYEVRPPADHLTTPQHEAPGRALT